MRGKKSAEEEIEVRGECGKGRQMLKADKQQSVASCVSSLRLNNKTAEQWKKEQTRRDERGEEEEEMTGLLSVCLSVCLHASCSFDRTGNPPQPPHTSPPQERRFCHATLKWVFNISRGSRHLPDVGCVLHMCCKLSVAVAISQTETAGDTVGGTQEALGYMGHIQTGAGRSVGVTQTYWAHTGYVSFTHFQYDNGQKYVDT